ncbi:phosphotransferase enzyme family protein [Akanthomyces lecanii RCEF 1005]|uniref:Phosphotransferase enzyme family protein n=1 Tax=Akanthomyces lecanii RCEF 1005 TaxID=1081108 RepID=A0A168HKA8_CORDF|nr:phosphotransferase enzyme family protein [Akanthomyces lecanii RCEF 1005]
MRSMQSDDSDTFVLTHPDLHYANIIVDEGLKIQGIIDWECASTIAQYLFTPPAWVTGHEGRGLLFPLREINDDFRKALELSEHQESKNHWRLHEESSVHLATAQILCRPNKLERLFYEYIFSAMFTGSHDEVISLFFADDKNLALAEEVDQQLKASERYTAYLEESGLYAYIEEERARTGEVEARIMKILFPDNRNSCLALCLFQGVLLISQVCKLLY